MNEVSIDCVALADRHGNAICKNVPYLVLGEKEFILFTPTKHYSTVEPLDKRVPNKISLSIEIEGQFWSDKTDQSNGLFVSSEIQWDQGDFVLFVSNLVLATSIFVDQSNSGPVKEPEPVYAHTKNQPLPFPIVL